ncbi:bacterioferritin [Roseiconus lacunae]|uniref:Bacterioferritin n=1 Tax=Roseiconus lacunae TaxID=2605694 RepID=A0ABT7PS17_9BACT|nr:bacterioferritin [Roseiconus lacunae]MCD0462578.1 bacterioferritin [Roseiconus lacunae]MDM4019235.1 bacterioferritin [Roseiconus lacunae]WRQ50668.1 bacterioferritin [Stieleria sp. HD01]
MASARSLENLQKGLAMELTASHQYQLHASVLNDWGLDLLALQMKDEMREELGHSDRFLERIMFLKGDPKMEFDQPPQRAKSLKELFETDLADEQQAVKFYTKAAHQASEDSDIGTKRLFEDIAIDEEEHIGWLELQLDLLERIGEPAYIAKHMSSPHDGGEN